MNAFFYGAATLGSLVAGLYFLRFWRDTLDRLFLMFALAFFLLGANYGLLGTIRDATEWRVPVFSLRLLAFSMIIYAIAHKNRR